MLLLTSCFWASDGISSFFHTIPCPEDLRELFKRWISKDKAKQLGIERSFVGINGFLDFVRTFREIDLFPSPGEEKEASTLLGSLGRALSKGINKQYVSLPSPEEENRSIFRNVLFSNCFEFRTM
jgi:hypothetical protein